MSDIFISYKREEQATARKLASALENEGWTVWWDPKLRAGEHFDDVIEKALNEAKCVIVLWSNLAVSSEYVKAEATEALEQKKLVPVKIESVNLPFRFKRVHTPSLLEWDGSKDSSEFQRLVEDIAAIVGPPTTDGRKGQTPDLPQAIVERASVTRPAMSDAEAPTTSPESVVTLREPEISPTGDSDKSPYPELNELYRKAVEGNQKAAFNLAEKYLNGFYTQSISENLLFKWMDKAATLGRHPAARSYLRNLRKQHRSKQ
jgi:hypothetical protein